MGQFEHFQKVLFIVLFKYSVSPQSDGILNDLEQQWEEIYGNCLVETEKNVRNDVNESHDSKRRN